MTIKKLKTAQSTFPQQLRDFSTDHLFEMLAGCERNPGATAEGFTHNEIHNALWYRGAVGQKTTQTVTTYKIQR